MGIGVGNYEWWEYFIIPWMAGIVGYGTNVLALQMTFYPLKFWGIEIFRLKNQPWGFFGWQGIIPTKAEKMATVCFELMTTRIINIKEVFQRLDPEQFSMVMEEPVLLLMDTIINEVAIQYMPSVWAKLPQDVKDEIIIAADKESGNFLEAFVSDMQGHIEDVLDIKEMTVSAVVKNKKLINLIFQECGDKEFTFIRKSGFYFGFLFGCIQMGIWFGYNASWVLPVFGFLVGYATNWLALKVIFRPLEPTKFLCWTLYGLFLSRQKEVSETFARVICVEVLHTKAMWDSILTGPKCANFNAMLRAHSIVFTEKLIGGLKTIAVAALGAKEFAMMKEDIAKKVMERLPTIIDHSYEYTTKALDLENTMRVKMQALSSQEFEGVLHPAFEEDEIILILVGGVLGCLVGIIQLVALFS